MDQAPNENQASNETQAPTVPRTPLGEPITDPASASQLAKDPVRWHLHYWLTIYVIGMIRDGDDADTTLLCTRIYMEQSKIADVVVRTQVRSAWDQYRIDLEHAGRYRWSRKASDDETAWPYLLDLDRMLKDKELKMQDRLARFSTLMDAYAREGKSIEANKISDMIELINQKLKVEKIADRLRLERFLQGLREADEATDTQNH